MKKFRWDLVGMFAGISGVLLAVIAVLKSGSSNRVSIAVAMVVVFGSMGLLAYKFLWQPRYNTKRLLKTGISSRAKILEVHDTNIAVNNNPQLKLMLELKNNEGQVYTTSCKTIASKKMPGYFHPGKEVKVKVDPQNEKNVVIDIT
jgi:hypothetical protein